MISKSCFIKLNNPINSLGSIFCFHYGGGNSTMYRSWLAYTPENITLIGVDLPGRGRRFSEPLIDTLDEAISSIIAEKHWFNKSTPFAFFGHSLGALLAFELTRILEIKNEVLPDFIALSGRNAPFSGTQFPAIHKLPKLEFIEELRKYKGAPKEVFENKELLELAIPFIRSDFAISEKAYLYDGTPIQTDILAIGGDQDEYVEIEDINAWGKFTTGKFESQIFNGGHFFIYKHVKIIINRMIKNMVV